MATTLIAAMTVLLFRPGEYVSLALFEFFTNSPHNTRIPILPTSFWLYMSKLTRLRKSATLKCNHIIPMTSNFMFTNITWCKSRSNCKYMEAQVGITVNFVCLLKCRIQEKLVKKRKLYAHYHHILCKITYIHLQ